MKKIIIMILVILTFLTILFVNGCEEEISIKELRLNTEDYVGKEIIVSGIVNRSTKIMTFAAFLLEDEEGKNSIWVRVAPDSILPTEGMYMRVKGTIVKEVAGYHIWAIEVKEI